MKYRVINRLGIPFLVTAALALALGPGASAAVWGSLRANNRESHEEHRGGESARQPAAIPRGEAERHGEPRQVYQNRGREFDAERRADIAREAHDRRRWDIDEDRHHGEFWYGFHPGMILNTLPSGYAQIYVGSNPYFYDQGVYYQSTPSGYTVVTPPLGAVVPALPPGAEAVPAGPTIYYYAAGAFYLQQPQGFVVVAPPLGITVATLPPGAVPVVINGVQYYQADGVYFMPVMQNGVTVFATVRP